MLHTPAKMLIVLGLVLICASFIWLLCPWLGKLPGDIRIQRDNFSLYLPITTCVIVSLVLSLILRIWGRS